MTPDGPFAPIYPRQSFLETPAGGAALRRLEDGLAAREPFLLVTGEAGTGKTALANEAIARWGARVTVAFLGCPVLPGAELLEEIIRRLGAEPPEGASRSKLVACFERALAEIASRGQIAMLVVDDAHHLSPALLEELRLLVNLAQQARRPLEVLLVGLPALGARLAEPALVALRQRVSVQVKIEPLSAAETRSYLHHRVAAVGGDGPSLFSRKTCRDIASRTGGVPRLINVLATDALRAARACGDQAVSSDHVQTAAAALGGFVPSGSVEDSPDAGSEDSPAPSAPSRSVETARAPLVAGPPAAVVASHIEESVTPSPAPPASHDSREWVARFVGDKGPLQLSSRALPESTWEPESPGANDPESPSPAGQPSKPRGRHDRARPRSHARPGRGLRATTAVLLAALVVVVAFALVMRAGGHTRGRAGHVAGVMTTATAPRAADKTPSLAPGDADRASSPSLPRAGARSAGAASPPRVNERRLDGTTPRSRQPYTLDVGASPDLETALAQRDRMQRLTGFEGWVVPASDGIGYRIVVGAYRSLERATAAANMLLNSKTLSNVTVVPLPTKTARQ